MVAPAQGAGPRGLRALFRAPLSRQTWVVLTYGLAWGILNWGFISFLPTFLRGAGFGARTASLLLLLSAVTAIPGTLLVARAYGVWSSRKSMVTFAAASVASALGLAWLSPDEHTSRVAIVAMLGLLYATTGGMIAMLSPYTAEVFPTALRGTGSGLSAGSSKLGGLLGALATVTGILTISGGMAGPAILVSLPVAAAAGLVAWRGRETRGKRLEEVGTHGELPVSAERRPRRDA